MSTALALRAFPSRQLPALRALVTTIVGLPLDEARVDAVVREVDEQVAAAGVVLRFGLVAMIDLLRVMPLVVLRRFALFERLGDLQRAECLARMDRSPRLATLLVAPKTLFTIAFYELPGELERVGYIRSRRRYLATSLSTRS